VSRLTRAERVWIVFCVTMTLILLLLDAAHGRLA
jgi:hypothetical protein